MNRGNAMNPGAILLHSSWVHLFRQALAARVEHEITNSAVLGYPEAIRKGTRVDSYPNIDRIFNELVEAVRGDEVTNTKLLYESIFK